MTIVLIFSFYLGKGQENNEIEINKNAISISGGQLPFYANMFVFQYSRVMVQLPKSIIELQVGYGFATGSDQADNTIHLRPSWIIGRKLLKLEVGFGVAYFGIDGVVLAPNLSLRLQKLDKGPYLRAGLGLPEGLYGSVGISF